MFGWIFIIELEWKWERKWSEGSVLFVRWILVIVCGLLLSC